MSVDAAYDPELLTGDGSETEFDFDFKIFNDTDLVVALVDPDTLVVTAQTLTTHYTVVINAVTPGGTVTFLTPPEDGVLVSIRRNVPITQETDIPSGGLFREEQIENALDKQTLVSQQLKESVDRAILQNPYATALTLVFPAAEANKIIGFDAAATGLENKTIMDADAQAAAAASASAAATSASEAATSASDAATSAVAAASAADSILLAVRGTFDDGDLSASGDLTITHNLALTPPYSSLCKIFDNTAKEIIPDDITGHSNIFVVALTSYGTLSGTWGYIYIA